MKYYVRVCRPRFDLAVFEVTADDTEEAERVALKAAARLPNREWNPLPYQPEAYFPHVELCVPESDFDAICETEDELAEARAEIAAVEPFSDIRYLLLRADVESGEGEVVFQPWFHASCPGVLERDIVGNWVHALEQVGAEGTERSTAGSCTQADENVKLAAVIFHFDPKMRRDS